MRLKIEAESTLTFDIEVEHEGKKASAILTMRGGEWQLEFGQPYDWKPIGNRRVEWPDALRRAIAYLAEEVGVMTS